MRTWRFGTTMFVGFGVLALLVAMIGLYSVFSYAVAQRTHEFGVRIALGGRASDVLGLVLREGIAIAATGVVLGAALALFLGRWIEPLLYEQPARDPSVFAAVAAVLIIVAVIASLVPGLRASSADPLVALRSE
jgi:putative ABC transport system permease protein